MPMVILVVEPHNALRKSLREWLELEFPRYRVIGASCAEEIIASTRTDAPLVIIVDIGLPGMNGVETVREMRAVLPYAQFVILTYDVEQAYRAEVTLGDGSAYVPNVPKNLLLTELIPTTAALLANIRDCAQ